MSRQAVRSDQITLDFLRCAGDNDTLYVCIWTDIQLFRQLAAIVSVSLQHRVLQVD